jgi:hypothetical protein
MYSVKRIAANVQRQMYGGKWTAAKLVPFYGLFEGLSCRVGIWSRESSSLLVEAVVALKWALTLRK